MELEEQDFTKSIEQLRKMLSQHEVTAELITVMDDFVLQQYILGKKGNIDKAFRSILCGAHTVFGPSADTVLKCDPRHTVIYDNGGGRVLRSKDNLGRTVVILRLCNVDLSLVSSLDDIIREVNYVIHTILSSDEACCRTGIVAIFDCKGVGFNHIRMVSSASISKQRELLAQFLNSNPMRLKGFHIVNHGRVLNSIIVLVRSLLPAKLKSRVHLHTNMKTLQEHFSLDILPTFLGGALDDEASYDDTFKEKMFLNTERFEKIQRCAAECREKFDGMHKGYDIQKCVGPGCGNKWG